MQKRMYFVLLRPIFCEKWKIAPPIRKEPPLRRLNLRNLGEKSLWILAKTFFFFFFWRSPNFGRKKPLNFRAFRDISETLTNRLKLIQGQWKFESTSYAHFSLFQNSPPLFQILATRLDGWCEQSTRCDSPVWRIAYTQNRKKQLFEIFKSV